MAAKTRPPAKQRDGERGGCSGGVGEQKDCGVGAGSAEGRAGEDEAEDRPGAGRPEQAGSDAEQEGVERRWGLLSELLRKPVAEPDERAREPLGKRGEEQRQAEDAEENQRGDAAKLVGADSPAAAHGREARDQGEGDGHAGEQAEGRSCGTAGRSARRRTAGPGECTG